MLKFIAFLLFLPLLLGAKSNPDTGCTTREPISASGVSIARTQVPTGSDGKTIEQRNIVSRLAEDNKPGSIKHLYVISAYSGQVIIYSTVQGKVTSGGKRLTPTSVAVQRGTQADGFGVNFGGNTQFTGEVLQDDGTYGHSESYLYWWDTKGVYHQHYVSGGQILHVSNQPLSVKGIIINMEVAARAD